MFCHIDAVGNIHIFTVYCTDPEHGCYQLLTLRLNDYRLPGSVWPYLSPEAGGGVGYGGLVQV
jgi:hypothetical protein